MRGQKGAVDGLSVSPALLRVLKASGDGTFAREAAGQNLPKYLPPYLFIQVNMVTS